MLWKHAHLTEVFWLKSLEKKEDSIMWMIANAKQSFCKCQQFALEFLQLVAVINIIINIIM